MLLKGSSLRNTEWVIGIAVYTGHETKIMKNSSKSKNKRSKNSVALNYYILICMAIQLICSLVSAIISASMSTSSEVEQAWYLQGGADF